MKTQLKLPVGDRLGRTLVAVHFGVDSPIQLALLDLAEKRHWRLFNLNKFTSTIPQDIAVCGALTDLPPTVPAVAELRRRGIPTVFIGGLTHPEDDRSAAVLHDHLAAGRMAADHFAERGFKHVAYVGRDPWCGNQMLYAVFAARAAEHGCTCHLLREKEAQLDRIRRTGLDYWRFRQKCFTRWLAKLPKPVGLLGFCDPVADRYCQWMLEAGLDIPEDVAVLGLGNCRFACESAAVPLSSLAYDYERLAKTAVTMLETLMAGQPLEHATVMVPPLGIVERHSTNVLSVPDPVVARAMRHIWDHLDQEIPIGQIAAHVGVSRSILDRAFLRCLGRTANAERLRKRLEVAAELLRGTSRTIAEVARATGFSSISYLHRVFKHEFGMTPKEYRTSRKD